MVGDRFGFRRADGAITARAAASDAMKTRRGRLLAVVSGGLLLNLLLLPIGALNYLAQSDFVAYDAGARIVRSGGCLYCIATQEAAVHAVAGTAGVASLDSIGGLVFISPPAVAWLFMPFAGLDPHVARVIFIALSLAALAGAGWLIASRWLPATSGWQRAALVIATVASVPAATGVAGQIDPIVFAAVVAGIVVSRRHPLAGGVLIGALALKPQLFVLVPFALLAGRHWRVLAGAGLSVALVGLSMFAQGLGHVLDWPHFVALYGSLSSWLPQSPPAVAGWLSGSWAVMDGTALVLMAAGAIYLWRRRRRLGSVQTAVGAGLALSLFASPHLFGYSLVFLAIPLATLANREWRLALLLALGLSAAALIDLEVGFAMAGPLLFAVTVALLCRSLSTVERRDPAAAASLPAGPRHRALVGRRLDDAYRGGSGPPRAVQPVARVRSIASMAEMLSSDERSPRSVPR